MGKLIHNTQIQHSSHPHLLELSNLQPSTTQPPCAGCNLQTASADYIYTCRPCNFFLHPSCANFPPVITHPSHPNHTLSLLPTPLYSGGFFRCDACGRQGNQFNYHCGQCDFDLHAVCASKPLELTHHSHFHKLCLNFSSPYGEKLGFSCDVCRNVGSSQEWLYRCVSCEFDVHLDCAASTPPVLQHHHHSFPGDARQNQFINQAAAPPLMHSMSTAGGVQSYRPPPIPAAYGGVQSYGQPPPPLFAPGGVQSYRQPAPPPPVATRNSGANTMMAFVEGALQQAEQDLVQSFIGGGGGSGGGDGGGVDSSFQSFIGGGGVVGDGGGVDSTFQGSY